MTDFLDDFSTRWLAAWNSHSTDRILDLLHPDIIWDDRTFWPDIINGISGMPAYVDKIWEAMPDVAFEEIERFGSADRKRGIVLFRQFGHGPAKLNPDATFDSHGCDIFLEFKDGKLASYKSAYDISDMLRQLGALPERGQLLGGAYLMSLLRRA
ncbi:nuclear transport factor 2 family protein [Gordonia polyisoprenivorans]|uniref:nuclear transport factor 2 family protein n=1 Tax=Gordonia polyisoprenivorans TaxID=84595 RepID=UPI001AD67728|nr:nuclear transport factor 2 family protein [Gordonia polyisoprenivorans]QTI69020.1 nuclear transport factor 2 family protein [Gordonia polyisoprenivorans]